MPGYLNKMNAEEERWAEASRKVRDAIHNMIRSSEAVGKDKADVAEDIADMVHDECGVTFRNEAGGGR